MGTITYYKPNGEWGIEGVDLATLPPKVYGALCKLHDLEHKDYAAAENFAKLIGVSVPAERLKELARAEKDGRLVVLPCKVGDTVYRVFHAKGREPVIAECEIKTIGQAADLLGRIGKKSIFISTHLTREEAEAALKRVKEG